MNERIQIDPHVCHGMPVIRGTRVVVSTILGAMAGGDSIADILEDYPNISEADIRAALLFASELCRFDGARERVNTGGSTDTAKAGVRH